MIAGYILIQTEAGLVVRRIQGVAGVLRTTTCPIISRPRDGRDGS